MTTVEDKIKLFSKIVYDKIKVEKQKDFDAFEKEKEEILKKEKEKIEIGKNTILKEAEKKAILSSNEIIAREKVDGQQKILKFKQKIVEDSLIALKERVIKFTDEPSYKEVLLSSIDNVLLNLDGNKYILYVTNKDINSYKEDMDAMLEKYSNIELELKEALNDIIGGVLLISQDGRFRIDNTLISIIEDSREYLGVKIMEKIG